MSAQGTDQGYQVDFDGKQTLVVVKGKGKPVQASLEAWQKLNELKQFDEA